MEQAKKTRQENVAAGLVGALLGSLAGVLCTVVIGQMGYVTSISGLVMAVGALKGYELLGGRLSKTGAVISSLLILIMTLLAHRLTWAIALTSVIHVDVLECFRAIPILLKVGTLESAPYWRDLAMLYLFTLLGAVPTIISGLRSTSMPDLPQETTAAVQGTDMPEAEFYPGKTAWVRPLRICSPLSMLVGIAAGVVLLFVSAVHENAFTPMLAAAGCIISSFVMMGFVLADVQMCDNSMRMMVRARGILWRVNLPMLNRADTYRFTRKTGAVRAIQWDRLSEEEQRQAKASILRAVTLLSSGQVMPGSALSLAVTPLTELQILKETSRSWKGIYSVSGGRQKKITIPKAYPNFVPAPGLEPADAPLPVRWSLLGMAVLLAVVLGLAGAGLGRQLDGPAERGAVRARPSAVSEMEHPGVPAAAGGTGNVWSVL